MLSSDWLFMCLDVFVLFTSGLELVRPGLPVLDVDG